MSRSWHMVFAVAVSACSRAEPSLTEREAPVVYGVDDRIELYQHPVREWRERALSVVAMVSVDRLARSADGTYRIIGGEPLGESEDLCAGEPFAEQFTGAGCSGALIDDALVLTAGHCVKTQEKCAEIAWVFDDHYEGPDRLATIDDDDVYRCVDVIADGADVEGPDLDVAIVQLDRAVRRRRPLALAEGATMEVGAKLVLIGFPDGIPLKIAPGGVVSDPSPDGPELDTTFVSSVDAFHGNSGSPVFDDEGLVVGVLVSGADDYEDVGSCSIVSALPMADAGERATYAWRAVAEMCAAGYPSRLCAGAVASCGDGFCTDGETPATCAGDCDGLFAATPACFGCPAEACNADGTCGVAWTCPMGWYHAGDDCDCGCGARDPDCDDPELDVYGCGDDVACLPDGTCDDDVPDAWTCSAAYYGVEDDCDCDCGAVDPDCAIASLRVYGCAPGSACVAGVCSEPIPDTWVCGVGAFGRDEACDCRCGAYDPDCDDADAELLNCADGETCDDSGHCVGPPPEPEPEPAVEVVEEVVVEDAVAAEELEESEPIVEQPIVEEIEVAEVEAEVELDEVEPESVESIEVSVVEVLEPEPEAPIETVVPVETSEPDVSAPDPDPDPTELVAETAVAETAATEPRTKRGSDAGCASGAPAAAWLAGAAMMWLSGRARSRRTRCGHPRRPTAATSGRPRWRARRWRGRRCCSERTPTG